jgi:hypothetical protein
LISIEVNPYTALVVCPDAVLKFSAGNAKKARNARECPSSNISVGGSAAFVEDFAVERPG